MGTRTLLISCALSAVQCLAVAAEDQAVETSSRPSQSISKCMEQHSRAFCIIVAGRIGSGMRDAPPADVLSRIEKKSGDALWYAGAAAGTAAGIWSPARGVSSGAETTLMLLGMLGSLGGGEPLMVGRNMIVAWMPKSEATTPQDADEKAQRIVAEAVRGVFSGSSITAETRPAVEEKPAYSLSRREQVVYRVKGGRCEAKDCVLLSQMMKDESQGILGTRSRLAKAPDFAGGGEAYAFIGLNGAIRPWSLAVDGHAVTHSYLQELSQRLPKWMYVVVSPERKFKGDLIFNEGQQLPVVYSEGKPYYFAFPEVDQGSKVGMTSRGFTE